MRKTIIILFVSLIWALPAGAARVQPLIELPAEDLKVDVWLDEADGSVYRRGQPVSIQFMASADCYVAVYNVDVDGYLHLLYPRYGDPQWVHGERIHSIPGPGDDFELVVDGPAGIEYVVAVASVFPLHLDVLDPVGSNGYRPVTYTGRITGDPSQGIWELNEELAWNGEIEGPEGYTSDVSWFYVRKQVPYPRFLVYDWYPDHYWDPYWDPYVSVTIWSDFYWDHSWCGMHWWWRGHRPSYGYWYRDHHHGPRHRWKTHVSYDPPTHRQKPPREVNRRTRPSRSDDSVNKPRRGRGQVDDGIRPGTGTRPTRRELPRIRDDRERVRPPADTRPTRRQEHKPAIKPSKPKPKPEAKPRTKPKPSKPKPEVKPKPKPEAKPKPKPETRSEDKPRPRPDRRDRAPKSG